VLQNAVAHGCYIGKAGPRINARRAGLHGRMRRIGDRQLPEYSAQASHHGQAIAPVGARRKPATLAGGRVQG
jgi:hypothetical protein